jgi:hypothetical protein
LLITFDAGSIRAAERVTSRFDGHPAKNPGDSTGQAAGNSNVNNAALDFALNFAKLLSFCSDYDKKHTHMFVFHNETSPGFFLL